MFYGCNALTSLDVYSFNTSNVTNMSYMFNRCSSLTNLDLSNFSIPKTTDIRYMFSGASRLTNIDISSFEFSSTVQTTGMFNSVPSSSLIYVKNDTSKEFILKVRNDLTNVQIKS